LHIDQLPTIVINKDIGELNHTKKTVSQKIICVKVSVFNLPQGNVAPIAAYRILNRK
ncbi:hypothetical protein T01_10656, partial [Trichinella spiralis]